MSLPNSLEQLAAVSTIIQSVLVIASLIFIGFQLRQNTSLTKAANTQALVEHFANFNALLMQNPQVARLWYGEGKQLENIEEMQRYRELLVMWLIFHENVYYQYNQRLLDKEIYASWLVDLRAIVRNHNLEVLGMDLAVLFPGKYGQHLSSLQQ